MRGCRHARHRRLCAKRAEETTPWRPLHIIRASLSQPIVCSQRPCSLKRTSLQCHMGLLLFPVHAWHTDSIHVPRARRQHPAPFSEPFQGIITSGDLILSYLQIDWISIYLSIYLSYLHEARRWSTGAPHCPPFEPPSRWCSSPVAVYARVAYSCTYGAGLCPLGVSSAHRPSFSGHTLLCVPHIEL
jgi:hypothetical protein